MKFIDRLRDYFAYYHEEDELPIDWCPICEEKLVDNKRKTRIEHNKLKHFDPHEKRKKIKRMLTIFAVVFVYFGIVGGVLLWANFASESNSWCVDEIERFNVVLRDENRYPMELQDDIVSAIENCNLRFGYFSTTDYEPDE